MDSTFCLHIHIKCLSVENTVQTLSLYIYSQSGDKEGFPSDWPCNPLRAPDDLETGLTRDEQLIVALHDRPRKVSTREERAKLLEELESVRKEMIDIIKEKFEYQRDVNRYNVHLIMLKLIMISILL